MRIFPISDFRLLIGKSFAGRGFARAIVARASCPFVSDQPMATQQETHGRDARATTK